MVAGQGAEAVRAGVRVARVQAGVVTLRTVGKYDSLVAALLTRTCMRGRVEQLPGPLWPDTRPM